MKKTLVALLAMGSMAMGLDTFTLDNAVGAFTVSNGSITSVMGNVSLSGSNLVLGSGGKWGADVTTDRRRTEVTFALTFDMAKINGVTEATKILTLGDWGIGAKAGGAADTVRFTGVWSTNADYSRTGDINQADGERSIVITLSSGGTRIYDGNSSTFYSNTGLKGDINSTNLVITELGLNSLTQAVVWADNAYDNTTGKAAGAFSTLESVPEPATGTLSLLALASLMARRRRK